jgi:hypothetical protein
MERKLLLVLRWLPLLVDALNCFAKCVWNGWALPASRKA